MHLHGHDITVVTMDGRPIRPVREQTGNTLAVDTDKTDAIILRRSNPDIWVCRCPTLLHTAHNGGRDRRAAAGHPRCKRSIGRGARRGGGAAKANRPIRPVNRAAGA